jgi:hypothetical protein
MSDVRRAKTELFPEGGSVAVVRDIRSRGVLFMMTSPCRAYSLAGQSVDSLLAAFAGLFPAARPFRKSGLHAAFRAPPGRHYLGWRVSSAPIETGEASHAFTELVSNTQATQGRLWVCGVVHDDTYPGVRFSSQLANRRLHADGRLNEVTLRGESPGRSTLSRSTHVTQRSYHSERGGSRDCGPRSW